MTRGRQHSYTAPSTEHSDHRVRSLMLVSLDSGADIRVRKSDD
jgi:hypothetical protein